MFNSKKYNGKFEETGIGNGLRVIMKRITFIATEKCTLKCKKCVGYFPFYAKNPWHPDTGFLLDSIDNIFSVIDEIGVFNLEGGEILLRHDLPEILGHLRKYVDRISVEIRFITNGTIVPSSQLMESCSFFGNKVYFIVDDYGSDLSRNAANASKALTDSGIRYELRAQHGTGYHGGWIDLGSFTKRGYSQEQVERVYNLCKGMVIGAERQFVIKKGKIYPCGRSWRLGELGIIDFVDFVDLFDQQSVREKREKLLKIKVKPYLEACGYCNGITKESPRVMAAEQYTSDELACLVDFDY